MDMDIDIDVDPRISALSYRDLQAKCKELGLSAKGKTDVLRKNLNDYLNDPKETLKRLAKEQRNRKNGGLVDWKKHPAKEILLEDLEPHGWLYGSEILDAVVVYEYYLARHKEIFDEIPFKQFQDRYNEAIQKAAKRRARSAEEEKMLKHDRCLHPRQTHNDRGEPVFDMDEEAKKQLIEDVNNSLHKKMEPKELWQSREMYRKYKLNKFRQRIYQYERRAKFLNWLEKQRNKQRDEFVASREPKEVTFERVPVAGKATKPPPPKIRGVNQRRKRSLSGKRSSTGAEPRKRGMP